MRNEPPMSRVRGHDWRRVPVPELARFAPTLPVSVIVSCHEAPEKLALTLAALERQTWPRELFEVVVVADGSRPPPQWPPSTALDIRMVRPEGDGFGPARARNHGARTARHDILVFLDCGVLPEAELLRAHARWHHTVADAVTLGARGQFAMEGLNAETIRNGPRALAELFGEGVVATTHRGPGREPAENPEAGDGDLFRALDGANFGIRRQFWELAGAMDESFGNHGGEATEFGWRAYSHGGLLVPLGDEAVAWRHEEPGTGDRTHELRIRDAILVHLVPHPAMRGERQGRIYTVPRYVVTLEAENLPEARILETTQNLLAGSVRDLVVRIETRLGGREIEWLQNHFGLEPRVRVASRGSALDDFPVAPFHIALPPHVKFGKDLVARLHECLEEAVFLSCAVPGGGRVSIARGWALHRARRTGAPIVEFGDTLKVPARDLQVRVGPGHPFWRFHLWRARWQWAWSKARKIRSPRQAWRYLRKAFRVIAEKLQTRFPHRVRGARRAWSSLGKVLRVIAEKLQVRLPRRVRRPPLLRHEPALGFDLVVLGARARAVFAASAQVPRKLEERIWADVVVADTHADVRRVRFPVIVLSEAPARLKVPAFNPRVDNPIGWHRVVADAVGTSGPVRRLPRGVSAARLLPRHPDQAALHALHHVEDVAAYHRNAVARAGELARLAANGAVVHLADGGAELAPLLGEELHALMTGELRDLDPDAREWLSIRMRRLAHRDHSLRARARQFGEMAMTHPPRLPRVSILLATRRPSLLSHALGSVARQNWPELELVLALHGDGFDAGEVERRVNELPCPAKVVRVDGALADGSALNLAADNASGSLLATLDDEAVYDANHVRDLMLAREYSGAGLVGRVAQFVWLRGQDRTMHIRANAAERYATGEDIDEGTLLLSRRALEEAGGWRRTSARAACVALFRELEWQGESIYQMHGTGYVKVLADDFASAGECADDGFPEPEGAVRDGWAPEFARIDQGAPPPPLSP